MNITKPFLLSITGAHSSCGKTACAEHLLRRLGKGWGALKYTKTPLYASVSEETTIEGNPQKDTSRLAAAGAQRVMWVQSPYRDLEEALSLALGRLYDLRGIVLEGNALLRHIEPDMVIFVYGNDPSVLKESAHRAIAQASILIHNKTADAQSDSTHFFPAEGKKIFTLSLYNSRKDDLDQCMEAVMKGITEKEIERSLLELAADSRITCAQARRTAEELGVSCHALGEVANRLQIKITACEPGCFP